MSKIKIQHFGPIREGFTENDGWMDINKVTVFIGNQGSGKSTVAKLISSFTWMEKALVRGDGDESYFIENDFFLKKILSYHRIEGYFPELKDHQSYLGYDGVAYKIEFTNGKLNISTKDYEHFNLPQIMYVPAERNFVAYVKSPKELKLSSDAMQEFIIEYENAKNALSEFLELPIGDAYLRYKKNTDTLTLTAGNYTHLNLSDASSGFQSLVPVYLVSNYLAYSVFDQTKNQSSSMSADELERFKVEVAEIYNNNSLSQEQKRVAVTVLSSKFNKTAFINIVEEPEQNLFPSSQWKVLQSLLFFNNLNTGNQLIMTTHSPYIINFLSIVMQGYSLMDKVNKSANRQDAIDRLKKIVDIAALVPSEQVVVYEMDEIRGTIRKLPMMYGIPSDKNYLNNMLAEGNHLFDQLLEIEETL